MIKHYLKIAFRNMQKYKIRTLISVFGLAIGFTFFAIGYNWMKYETSYDSFYPDSEHIYRIYGIDKQSGRKLELLPFILSEKIQQEFPEVEKMSLIYPNIAGGTTIWEETVLGRVGFTFVDRHFLELFPPKIICGKNDRLLHATDEMVVTEKFAKKHWGSADEAIGKVLKVGNNRLITIVSVMENRPDNSNFHSEGYLADIIFRPHIFGQTSPDNYWDITPLGEQFFILLNKNANISTFREKIRNYAIDNHFNEDLVIETVPIADMRHTLSTDLSFNATYIRTFTGAGLLLLFCSIFNFLNLYFNRMIQRVREIKLRKTVGGHNYSITTQLQTELAVHLALTFILSCLLLKWAMPVFEQSFETTIIAGDLWSRFLFISITGFVFLLASCLLAQIKFTRFSSLTQTKTKYDNRFFRNASIGFQLAICIFFLMSAFIFYKQITFMNHFDWGFKKDGLIRITMTQRDKAVIIDHIRQLASVQQFISSDGFNIKTEPKVLSGEVKWIEKSTTNQFFEIENVGNNFIDGFGIPIVKGRFFENQDIISEETGQFTYNYTTGGMDPYIRVYSTKVVVNEEMEKLMGKENIIGETIEIPTGRISNFAIEMKTVEIIGVIKNFHTLSLQKPVYPLILNPVTNETTGSINYVRVAKGTERQTIAAINEIFKNNSSPGDPEETDIVSMTQLLDDFSKSERAGLQLFAVLAALCILISIFGIYAISLPNMERRKKEIAVRKVYGATVADVIIMFIKEYSKILLLANLIALPPALFFMNRWLMQYAYHTGIHSWIVLIVVAFTFVLVISTVLSQVIEAASQNPAEVVKSE